MGLQKWRIEVLYLYIVLIKLSDQRYPAASLHPRFSPCNPRKSLASRRAAGLCHLPLTFCFRRDRDTERVKETSLRVEYIQDFVQTQCDDCGVRCNAHPSIRSRRSIHPSYHLYPRSRAIRTLPSNPHSHLSPLPRRSFFSISPFFLGASFFFKPFDSNWFLSRPLIRTPFVLPLSVYFLRLAPSRESSLPLPFPLSPRCKQVWARICSLVPFRPVQRTFLFLSTLGKGICERKAHEIWKGVAETPDICTLYRTRRERWRSDSVENQSSDSPIIAILLFSVIILRPFTKNTISLSYLINSSFAIDFIYKKKKYCNKLYFIYDILYNNVTF